MIDRTRPSPAAALRNCASPRRLDPCCLLAPRRPGRRLVREPEAPPGADRRARARRRRAAAPRGARARSVFRRRRPRLRRSPRPARHAFPARRLARAAHTRARHDVQLWRHRATARPPYGGPRRRRRGRPQSRLDHRAVPSRRRQHRFVDRLRRRPRRKTALLQLESSHPRREAGTLHRHWGRALRPRDIAELFALAALWGGSFLFMRIAAPAFGPVVLAALRVAGAALSSFPCSERGRDVGARPPLAADRRRRPHEFGVALSVLLVCRAVDQCRRVGDLQFGHPLLRRRDRLGLARRSHDADAHCSASRSALPASSGSPGTRPASGLAARPGRSAPASSPRSATASPRA